MNVSAKPTHDEIDAALEFQAPAEVPGRANRKIDTSQESEAGAILSMIGRLVTDPSVDIERLDRMLQVKERLDAEQERKEREAEEREAHRRFIASMVDAQREIQPVANNRNNTHTRSKYADYSAIADAIKPIITRHGFSTNFFPEKSEIQNHFRIRLVLSHVGGHQQEYSDDFPSDSAGANGNSNKTAIQGMKSTQTYARRMLTLLAFDVATGDDNDGNAAPKPSAKTVSESQFEEIRELVEKSGADERKLLSWLGVKALDFIPASQFAMVKAKLERKIKEAEAGDA